MPEVSCCVNDSCACELVLHCYSPLCEVGVLTRAQFSPRAIKLDSDVVISCSSSPLPGNVTQFWESGPKKPGQECCLLSIERPEAGTHCEDDQGEPKPVSPAAERTTIPAQTHGGQGKHGNPNLLAALPC